MVFGTLIGVTIPAPNPTPPLSTTRRHFLGWNAPILPKAAAWLFDQLAPGFLEADFSTTIVVVPGARSGRLLLGMLVDEAGKRCAALVPPLLVTPGEVIEPLLGVPRSRPAGPIARQLAWLRAISMTSQPELQPLLGAADTRDESVDLGTRASRSLGPFLERTYTELGGHGLRFEDVIEPARELAGSREAARWRTAAQIADRFRSVLMSLSLSDEVHDRIATFEQMTPEHKLRARSHITRAVIVGVPELPGLVRRALLTCGNRHQSIDVLIHAPESFRDTFDDLGCTRSEAWASCTLPIEEDQISFATDLADQAARAFTWLATTAPDAPVDDVVIGLADESLADLISLELRRFSTTHVRSAAGYSAERAEPARVLLLVSKLLERRGFDELMALARHPRVERWLLESSTPQHQRTGWAWWLQSLEEYAATQSPGKLHRLPEPTERVWNDALELVRGGVASLLGDLWNDKEDGAESPIGLAQLSTAALQMLDRLYGHLPATSSDPAMARLAESCIALAEDLRTILAVSNESGAELGMERPSVILGWLVAHQASHTIASPPDADAIEMVGWLELAHDPSPIAVVIGMNDCCVPGVRDHDSILPTSLRKALRMPTATDRLARDSFLASTIARSRRQTLFIAPRRDEEGLPLIPSRLLLRCANDVLAPRMRRALGRHGDGPSAVTLKRRAPSSLRSQYPLAPIGITPPVSRVPVTAFRDYLASPYLFYLRHVLRLRETSEPTGELDPMAFGILIHSALESFGRSGDRDSLDPRVIRDCVLDHLSTIAAGRFGPHPSVAIAIQKEHATARLSRWAEVQATRAADGWRIRHSEWARQKEGQAEGPAPRIDVPEGSIELRGRIDRIDVHEDSGKIMVLDYKSSDTPGNPGRTHRARDGTWRDLQLPLYRNLIQPLGFSGEVSLGYFNLPRDLDEVGVSVAPWNEEDLASADETARAVVSHILRSEFGDIGRMDQQSTLGLIAGVGVLSDFDASSGPNREDRT